MVATAIAKSRAVRNIAEISLGRRKRLYPLSHELSTSMPFTKAIEDGVALNIGNAGQSAGWSPAVRLKEFLPAIGTMHVSGS